MKRIVLGLFAPVFYQAAATQIDKRNYPAPGRMVEVDGQRPHVYSMGKE